MNPTGKFLVKNYEQALGLIDKLTGELAHAKDALEIEDDSEFVAWLEDEAAFLALGPTPVSERETEEMMYVKTLVDLKNAQYVIPLLCLKLRSHQSLTGNRTKLQQINGSIRR